MIVEIFNSHANCSRAFVAKLMGYAALGRERIAAGDLGGIVILIVHIHEDDFGNLGMLAKAAIETFS